jgi:hypothetical protein
LLNGADSDPNRKPEPTDSLEQRVTEDPYDADAWLTLLNEAEREGEVSRVRDVYERFLKVYPTSVSCLFSLECSNMGICHHFVEQTLPTGYPQPLVWMWLVDEHVLLNGFHQRKTLAQSNKTENELSDRLMLCLSGNSPILVR